MQLFQRNRPAKKNQENDDDDRTLLGFKDFIAVFVAYIQVFWPFILITLGVMIALYLLAGFVLR